MPASDRDAVKPYHGKQAGVRAHTTQWPAHPVAAQTKTAVDRIPVRQSPLSNRTTS